MKAFNLKKISTNTHTSTDIKILTKPALNKTWLLLFTFTYGLCLFDATAQSSNNQTVLTNQQHTAQNKQIVNKKIVKSPYIIETLVQGSQEQPNVIYITPWQDNEQAVNIQGQSLQVLLPKLTPINPKTFKQQLNNHYQSKP